LDGRRRFAFVETELSGKTIFFSGTRRGSVKGVKVFLGWR
jgi:hypothetical protein